MKKLMLLTIAFGCFSGGISAVSASASEDYSIKERYDIQHRDRSIDMTDERVRKSMFNRNYFHRNRYFKSFKYGDVSDQNNTINSVSKRNQYSTKLGTGKQAYYRLHTKNRLKSAFQDIYGRDYFKPTIDTKKVSVNRRVYNVEGKNSNRARTNSLDGDLGGKKKLWRLYYGN